METIVIYPSPGLSHLISTVELAKLLLSHSHSLSSITFLITTIPSFKDSSLSSYISSVSSSFPSIAFHSLPPPPLTKHPSDYPSPEEILFETLRNNTSNVHDALHSILLTHSISALILDFFCHSALDVSRSFDIPTYFFFTTNAAALALFLNYPVMDETNTFPFRNNPSAFDIPGLFPVTADHIIEPMLAHGECYHEFVKVGEALSNSNGIIVNTFDVLEPRAVMSLKEGTCLPGRRQAPPIYCVGPLIVDGGANSFSLQDDQHETRHECLSWLDSQPCRSVVYLAFGTHGRFDKEQIREIGVGLERSGVRFLWVVRAPPSEDKAKRFTPSNDVDFDELLPQGFMERTKDRGLVVKSWAPQIAVLSHGSVGGFVTHCGWNSCLEAVSAGVPMVAWPLYAEQGFNKKVIVDEIKIALPMDVPEDRFVRSDEVERRLKQLMSSEDGNVVRENVVKLKDEAKNALSEGGSAQVALSSLVESWKR